MGATGCGFACQIHHRMTCVALSYILGYPLIHDQTTGWAFEKAWNEAFQPLGSQCKAGPLTITVYWSETGPLLSTSKFNLCTIFHFSSVIDPDSD